MEPEYCTGEIIQEGRYTSDLRRVMQSWGTDNSVASLLSLKLPTNVALIDVRDNSQASLLHVAFGDLNIDVAWYLIEAGCDVNALDDQGNNALMYDPVRFLLSPVELVTKFVELLIDSGCRLDIKNLAGESPLSLIRESPSPSPYLTKLIYSSMVGSSDDPESVATLLLEHGWTLTNVVMLKDTNITRCVIERGADVNKFDDEGDNALYTAVRFTDPSQVQLLLEHVADPRALRIADSKILQEAVENDNEGAACPIIELLLKYDVLVDFSNFESSLGLYKALLSASYRSKSGCVDLLLRHGVNVNVDHRGDLFVTPLLVACGENSATPEERRRTVQLLLEYGADVRAIKLGRSALQLAIPLENEESSGRVPLLLQHYAKLEFMGEKVLLDSDVKMFERYHHFGLKKYYDDCWIELGKMRDTRIGRVRMLNVLLDDVKSLAKYARNEELTKMFEEDGAKSAFPIYAETLGRKFDEVKKTRTLLDNATDALASTLMAAELPRHVFEKIVAYLNSQELRTLAE